MNEPGAADVDVRVGSSTDALTPVSVGRALAGGARAAVGWASEPSWSRRSPPTS